MSYMTVGSSGTAEKIGSALKGAIDFYGQSQADKATADLARAQAAAGMASGQTAGGGDGFPFMTVALLGAAGLTAYMLFKKKRSA